MRQLFYSLFIISFLSCNNTPATVITEATLKPIKIAGKTMGTTYHITYFDEAERDLKVSIDSLLVYLNEAEVSTYEPNSLITQFNKATVGVSLEGGTLDNYPHFKANYESARKIHTDSEGLFDPTIGPLVNYWGFGYTEKKAITQADMAKVKSLMQGVGFDKVSVADGQLRKAHPTTQLDLGAIAKGYGVDLVGQFLRNKGIKNFIVEIGGETYAHGTKAGMQPWVVGINTPRSDAKVSDYELILKLENKAIATSGNYRIYYDVAGEKYSHFISTKSGYPEKSDLLSVSVIANDCMTADGYATYLMLAGKEKGLEFVNKRPELEAYFIFANESNELVGIGSDGFDAIVLE